VTEKEVFGERTGGGGGGSDLPGRLRMRSPSIVESLVLRSMMGCIMSCSRLNTFSLLPLVACITKPSNHCISLFVKHCKSIILAGRTPRERLMQ